MSNILFKNSLNQVKEMYDILNIFQSLYCIPDFVIKSCQYNHLYNPSIN